MIEERPGILARVAALADVTRARLLLLLEGRELSVSELCTVLQLPQSTVSRHLKWLIDDGWLSSRRDGTSRHYSLDLEDLAPSAAALWQAVRGEIGELPVVAEDAGRLASVVAGRRTRSQAFFSSAAAAWDELRQELYGEASELPALLALLDDRWVVGDLGCGTGRVSALLAPFVRRVIAVDSSPEMLDAARRRLAGVTNVELRRGEIEQLPLADGELDAVCLVLVLHHLADPGRALAEAARCLKPGGRLVVVDLAPHDRREWKLKMGHQWLGFSADQLGHWAAGAGFEALRLQPLSADPDSRSPSLFVAAARTAESVAVPERLNRRSTR